MYCRKCGRWLEENQACPDCAEVEVHFGADEPIGEAYEEPRPAPVAQQGSRMEGFKGALTGTILGAIGYMLAFLGFIYAYTLFIGVSGEDMAGMEMLFYLYGVDMSQMMNGIPANVLGSLSACCCVIGLGLGIPAIILGAKSIATFKRMKNAGKVKPIATLILGIVGLVMGICAVVIAACNFLIILSSFMLASL